MATGLFSGSSAKKRFVDAPIEDQITELRDEIASLAKLLSQRGAEASKDVRTKAHDAREQAEASLYDLIENGEQLFADLRSRYALTERQVRHTVREHPVATLGAAAALGLLIAALIRR
jgi:ElaB/YqjD/DUF883 family membrane-anchored ribosome-binding protein